MLTLEKFVPSEYLNDPNFALKIQTKKLFRYKLFSKFLKAVESSSKEISSLSLDQLEIDLEILESNEQLFKLKPYEEECLKYGLEILDSHEITDIFLMLYFNSTFYDIFILKHIFSYYSILKSKKNILFAEQIIQNGEKIYNKIKEICNTKGLTNFFEANYSNKLKSLHILDSYIELLSR